MAVKETSGFLRYKDSEGNSNLFYPITTKDNVDGLDELENELANTLKVTSQTLTEAQKAQARLNIGAAIGDGRLGNNIDFNTITQSGMYRFEANNQNGPSGVDWGQLLVVHGGGDTIAQIAFDYSSSRMWVRTGNPSGLGGSDPTGWSNWAECYTTNNPPESGNAGGDVSSDHVNNKNNPHGVTASQIGAATLDYVKKVGNPFNLLKNSDLTDPVNTAGFTSTNVDGVQTINRWFSNSGDNAATISLDPSGMTIAKNDASYGGIYQNFEHYADMYGKTYTAAVCVNGIWECTTFVMGKGAGGSVFPISKVELYSVEWAQFLLRNYSVAPITIQRVGLFEGEYTAETLTAYQPKGYWTEYIDCNGVIPGTYSKWLPQNGMSMLSFPDGITTYSVNPGNMIAEGAPNGFSTYATVTAYKLGEYHCYEYADIFGKKASWNAMGGYWEKIYTTNNLPTPADIGAVTAAEVTTMINNALGVIENGAY